MTLRAVFALLFLSVMAGCGADGDPIPPGPETEAQG